jgi:hypothetical protein
MLQYGEETVSGLFFSAAVSIGGTEEKNQRGPDKYLKIKKSCNLL